MQKSPPVIVPERRALWSPESLALEPEALGHSLFGAQTKNVGSHNVPCK